MNALGSIHLYDRPISALSAALRCALVFFWLLAGACTQAAAQTLQDGPRDAITSRAWLDDPESSLSPQAARDRAWTPFADSLSRGYTASTTWLRLRIDPSAAGPARTASDHRLVLRILPGHLDEVAMFRLDRLSQPPVLVGDTHQPGGAAKGFAHHAVVIDDAVAPFDVLLRLRTQSNHSIHIQALRWDDARELSFSQLNLVFAYLAFTAMVIAWAVFDWLEQRDPLLGLFIAHQGSALVVAVTLMGVMRLYGPDWLVATAIDRLTSLVIPLHAVLTVLFHARLLADLGSGKSEIRLLQALATLPAIGLLLVTLGQVRAGLMLTQATIPVIMPLLIVIAWRARSDLAAVGQRHIAWRRAGLVAVYVAMASLAMPQSLRVLGLLPARAWTYGGFIAYSVASSMLLGSLLWVRARQARRRREQIDLDFLMAQREAEAQRARATEQAELMTMLTHELNTPLSVLSLALGSVGDQPSMRKRALRAVVNMRNVIGRCAQVALVDDEVERGDASPALAPVALDEVLAEAVRAQLHADRVDCQMARDLPTCLADRQMLQVIVGNLLENALKYSPLNGRVRASVHPAEFDCRPGVALRVSNRVGPAGRPDAAHVFEKYHRGLRARHRSGSGLGLYLSRRLADRLGSELSLLESGGDEVSFELWLPC